MIKICIELMNGKKMNFNLLDEVVPNTVNNFLRYVDEGLYNNTVFHRIIKGFMSQGGGYVIDNTKLKERVVHEPILGEFISNKVYNPIGHYPGVISMARTNDPNSATSQFFICSNNAQFLNNNYAAFGYIADQESLLTAEGLNKLSTTNIGGGMTDFPVGDITAYTIKSIYRV